MRLFFLDETARPAYKTDAYFKVSKVDWSIVSRSNRRDLWIRVKKEYDADSYPVLSVWDRRDNARALALADNYLAASANITGTGAQVVTLTNNASTDPDLTGLRINCTVTATDGGYDAVWGYIASPAWFMHTLIDGILAEYITSGKALADFSTARLVAHGDELIILSKAPQVVATSMAEYDAPSIAGKYALEVPFHCVVGHRGLSASTLTADVLGWAGTLRSILGDERRTLEGFTVGCDVTSTEGPIMAFGAIEPYFAAEVRGTMRIPEMETCAT